MRASKLIGRLTIYYLVILGIVFAAMYLWPGIRGYLPRTTHSAHFIADPGLRRAIDDYLKRERAYVAEAGRELAGFGPFRKDADEAP